jgi:two-component system, NtrC family, response regulator AtoC
VPDSGDKWEDTQTHAMGPVEPTGGDKLQLIVSVEGAFTTHRLPSSGAVTIGRAPGNFVRIEHPSISRSHAVLQVGAAVRVLDLESSNGTRIAGHRIEPNTPVDVAAGDALELGAVMVMIQRVAAALPPRRVLSHDYFEARVEEECARRARSGGAFAVVRINASIDVPRGEIEEAFQETLRAHDVLALYAPNEYEFLVDATPEHAAEVVGRLKARLAEDGISVRSGVACYPSDGATAGALIACANGAVRGSIVAPAVEDVEDGAESAMDGLRRLVERIAASTISVLILGETGVGKEVLAETVHRLSPRASRTFLRLNCAALSETLLESELFGHERGAFTGAHAQKRGLLETADGGTVFLDEVGELPMTTQVKLLRVIEERKVMRVGGLHAKDVDVRFVAATNRDLEAEVARGAFRQDLFFRLNGVTVVVPPLRERPAEIEKLAHLFLAQSSRDRPHTPELSPDAIAQLLKYSWPGNIREFRNVIERAVLLSGAGPITSRHLPLEKMTGTIAARPLRHPQSGTVATLAPPAPVAHGPENATDAWPAFREAPPTMNNLKVELEAVERQRILDALERCAWNQTKAAQMLGIARGTLVSRLDQYGIARPRKGNV